VLIGVLQSWLFCNSPFPSRPERGIKVTKTVEPDRVIGNVDFGEGA
jgi:hypothetical protein